MYEYLFYSIITGMICGFITTAWIKAIILQRIEEEEESELQSEVNAEQIIRGRIETTEGYLLIYNRDTGDFLANGRSWDELNDKLTQRFPNTFFDVPTVEIERAKEYAEVLK